MSQSISKEDLDRWNQYFNAKMARAEEMVKAAMDQAKQVTNGPNAALHKPVAKSTANPPKRLER